jgi:hypothetical protein
MRLIRELRKLHIGLARRVDAGSPLASIRLFCLECMGGSRKEVATCTAPECPLYKLRLGKRAQRAASTTGDGI